MTSAQVQRTIVKSPPELWAEISDPAALARHLGELGEIRITRIEPEHKVEWASDDTTGAVLIKPSGWGTRVTLTASREASKPGPSSPPTLGHNPPAHDRPPATQEACIADGDATAPGAAASQATASEGATPEAAAPDPVAPEPAVESPSAPERLAQQPSAHQPPSTPTPPARTEPPPAVEPITSEQAQEIVSWKLEPAGEPRRRFLTRVLARLSRQHPAQASAEAPPAPDDATPAPDSPDAPMPLAESPQPVSEATPSPLAEHPSPASEAAPTPVAAQPPNPISKSEPAPLAQAPPPTPSAPSSSLLEQAFPPGKEGPPELSSAEPTSTAPGDATESAGDDVAAVLTSVLDSLGAAHHRPFSRA